MVTALYIVLHLHSTKDDTKITARLTNTDKIPQKNKQSQSMTKFISIDENEYILKDSRMMKYLLKATDSRTAKTSLWFRYNRIVKSPSFWQNVTSALLS